MRECEPLFQAKEICKQFFFDTPLVMMATII